ncbi:MAG: hypothetical protein KA314_06565 [Chloroflexi bacterium]|nr:hypothetical protein [Chloroflexota bacterium]MBP8055487.1 hypothetical protein [Chloroflexota bacterium]
MHFEILTEDMSGKTALEILIPKIIDTQQHTFRVKSYKGVGHLPGGLKPKSDPQKRILLDQLPRLIQGYGRTFAGMPGFTAVLIIVFDLDDRCLKNFRRELLGLLNNCHPKPGTYFCLAVEEGEAWYLGDFAAVKSAYPNAKDVILDAYINDSICDTWEKLADAVYSGGAHKLKQLGWQSVGREKAIWAERISPFMIVDNNLSPSFCYFRDKLRHLSNYKAETE